MRVRLEAGEAAEGDPQDNIVRLAPPEDFPGDLAEWSTALSEKVLGFGLQVDYMSAGGIPAAKIQAARAGLPGVRQRFLAPHPAAEEYYVKFACSVEGAGVEYLWLKVGGWDDQGVAGTLLTEPALAKQFTAGQPLRVAEPEVVDWMIRERRRQDRGPARRSDPGPPSRSPPGSIFQPAVKKSLISGLTSV